MSCDRSEPRPAFIHPPRKLPWPYESLGDWVSENVPDGYVYKPATDHTVAAWVPSRGER